MTDEFLQISRSGGCLWPNFTNKINLLLSRRSSWLVTRRTPVNSTVSLEFFLAASDDFARSNSYLEILSATFMQPIL